MSAIAKHLQVRNDFLEIVRNMASKEGEITPDEFIKYYTFVYNNLLYIPLETKETNMALLVTRDLVKTEIEEKCKDNEPRGRKLHRIFKYIETKIENCHVEACSLESFYLKLEKVQI